MELVLVAVGVGRCSALSVLSARGGGHPAPGRSGRPQAPGSHAGEEGGTVGPDLPFRCRPVEGLSLVAPNLGVHSSLLCLIKNLSLSMDLTLDSANSSVVGR